MADREERMEEQENQAQDAAEVTELDDQALEDASGGALQESSINENCSVC